MDQQAKTNEELYLEEIEGRISNLVARFLIESKDMPLFDDATLRDALLNAVEALVAVGGFRMLNNIEIISIVGVASQLHARAAILASKMAEIASAHAGTKH